MLYHVTPAENLESILMRGLVPHIGARSAQANEALRCVYLFTSAEACETALMNWLSDEFEDTELVVLELDRAGVTGDVCAGFELACPTPSRLNGYGACWMTTYNRSTGQCANRDKWSYTDAICRIARIPP